MQTYNWKNSLLKALVKGSAFAFPIVIAMLPKEWMNLTLGTIVYMALDYVQKKHTNL